MMASAVARWIAGFSAIAMQHSRRLAWPAGSLRISCRPSKNLPGFSA